MNVLILSPHADDAAFSCADHIRTWRKQGHSITVCTIFTVFRTAKLSSDARWYVRQSGFTDITSFEKARAKEDTNALQLLEASYISPNLPDGAFRVNQGELVYPNFGALFSGQLSNRDIGIQRTLQQYIRRHEHKYDVIFAPLGIGRHADHLLTSLSATASVPSQKLGIYFDVPYFFHPQEWKKAYINAILHHQISITWTSTQKKRALSLYTSQTPLIIRNNKQFYFNNHLMIFPEMLLLPQSFHP